LCELRHCAAIAKTTKPEYEIAQIAGPGVAAAARKSSQWAS
jgi:hypothetical protein